MQSTPKKHWRSLAELEGSPEFKELVAQEFPGLDADTDIGEMDGVTRRRFLQLMGGSMALAGAASCRWEAEEILPLASRPANRIPGKALHYASALQRGGHGVGVTLTSYDGRPIKVEGNPECPISGGATDLFAQAEILSFYDPDRSRTVLQGGAPSDFETFDKFWVDHVTALRAAKGAGLAFLAEASSSPTEGFLRTYMLKGLKQAKWVEYEPVSRDNEVEGAQLAFGDAFRAQYNLAAAKVVVSFDGDLFSNHPAQLKHNRDWALARAPKHESMGRMYAAESRFTIDGGMADHRVPMRSGDVPVFLALVEAYLAEDHSLALADGTLRKDLPKAHAATDGKAQSVAKAIAKDLASHSGRSILVAGPNQPADVHARIHHLNALLGNVGRTVTYTEEPAGKRPTHEQGLRDLVAAIDAGEVKTLVIVEGNVAYDAPVDIDIAAALAKVEHTVRLGQYANETSALCGWHLPRAHAFESWGDALAWDGTYLVSQPTIAPLWGARSLITLLAPLATTKAASDMTWVSNVAGQLGKAKDKAWRKAVHDGVVPKKQLAAKTPVLEAPGTFRPAGVGDQIEITFAPDTKVWDGRYANSAWLQELPDFMTKLTWDNVALVAPATAEKLGIEIPVGSTANEVSLMEVTVDGKSATLPVYIMPGQAQDSIALALGYGRTRAGVIGGWDGEGDAVDPVGVDVYSLRKAGVHNAVGQAKKVAGSYPLAMTQDHHLVDPIGMDGVAERLPMLVREENVEEFDPNAHDHFRHAVHHPELESLWTEKSYGGHAWGLSIDLSACNGCNACVVACQAENNIPTVGKTQVIHGREMHWMRIDRYFAGDADSPELATQPINCQQCEMAPCEQVCPVAATTHSDDGLNDMVYNRCVGTRYCANNCPYKVRRFNYLNYRKDLHDPDNEVAKLGLNPEVTVRSRGVMEKCTYCVQRINEEKIEAKNAGQPIADGSIRTACQQVCPPQAIIFGDKGDPSTRVSQLHQDPRAYELLAELNTKPRNNFLAKIRNPHPDLAQAAPTDENTSHDGGH
jgi:molybdopterin-containing oxidoreductase family iron-sulfur binding subunit